jgi:hypothetical protein
MTELINFKDQQLNLDYLTLNIPNSVGWIQEFVNIFFRHRFNFTVSYNFLINYRVYRLFEKKLLP